MKSTPSDSSSFASAILVALPPTTHAERLEFLQPVGRQRREMRVKALGRMRSTASSWRLEVRCVRRLHRLGHRHAVFDVVARNRLERRALRRRGDLPGLGRSEQVDEERQRSPRAHPRCLLFHLGRLRVGEAEAAERARRRARGHQLLAARSARHRRLDDRHAQAELLGELRSQAHCDLGEKLAADQPAADLGRARADLVELGVAPQPAGRRLVDVAHAAERLDRLARHPGGLLGGVEDGAGGVLAAWSRSRSQRLPHGVDVGAAGGECGVHVGELALHELEFADRLAELLALVHVRAPPRRGTRP